MDADDEDYDEDYRIRTIGGIRTLVFDRKPPESQDITMYYSKRLATITSLTFSTEFEIDPDFHDLYIHFLKAKFYEKMLENESSGIARQDYFRRLNDLEAAVSDRWDDGHSDTIKVVW